MNYYLKTSRWKSFGNILSGNFFSSHYLLLDISSWIGIPCHERSNLFSALPWAFSMMVYGLTSQVGLFMLRRKKIIKKWILFFTFILFYHLDILAKFILTLFLKCLNTSKISSLFLLANRQNNISCNHDKNTKIFFTIFNLHKL